MELVPDLLKQRQRRVVQGEASPDECWRVRIFDSWHRCAFLARAFPTRRNSYYMTSSTQFRALLPSVSARNVPFEVSDEPVLARRNDLVSEVGVPLAPYSRRPADRVDFINHE